MSAKSMFVTEYRWRKMPGSLRNLLMSILSKAEIVGRYACNVADDLRARGCPEAADDLLEELGAQATEAATGEYVDTANRKAARNWPNG